MEVQFLEPMAGKDSLYEVGIIYDLEKAKAIDLLNMVSVFYHKLKKNL